MNKISASALAEVKAALIEWQREVDESGLADSTKMTYREHPNNFVRWLSGDFVPGGTLDGRGRQGSAG